MRVLCGYEATCVILWWLVPLLRYFMVKVKNDNFFMYKAIYEAYKTSDSGDVPVGCVIVKDGKIIARGHNTREKKQCACDHAEINAIKKACKKMDSWRLTGCTMYVTLEPCPMCAGAIINSRLDKVVFGAHDMRYGALGGKINLLEGNLEYSPEVESGIKEKECADLLKTFFKKMRVKERTKSNPII